MEFLKTFIQFTALSAPYLLLGMIVSAFLKAFLSDQWLKKNLAQGNIKEIFLASFVGVPLPLCSCAVIPMAITLRRSGASNGATSSFLISTPESGVDSIMMTYALMDFPMSVIRPIVAFVSAIVAGLLQYGFNEFQFEEKEEHVGHGHCCKSKVAAAQEKPSLSSRIKQGFSFAFGSLINDIAAWLFFGLIMGSLIDHLVPADFLAGLHGWKAFATILVIGVPLYICASASTPIAASLVLKGLSPGAALLFLLVGPATNISNIFILQKYIGKKGVVINILSIVGVGIVAALLTDAFYTSIGGAHFKIGHMSHGEHLSWLSYVCAVFLLALIAKGIWAEHLKKLWKK